MTAFAILAILGATLVGGGALYRLIDSDRAQADKEWRELKYQLLTHFIGGGSLPRMAGSDLRDLVRELEAEGLIYSVGPEPSFRPANWDLTADGKAFLSVLEIRS